MQNLYSRVGAILRPILLLGLLMASPAAAQSDYVLMIDTAYGDPGTNVDIEIRLTNPAEVAEFNLLIGYDPSALWPQHLTLAGTRAAGFEQFSFEIVPGGMPGKLRLIGIADVPGGSTPAPMAAGEGPIAVITMQIINDISFSGMWIPVWFQFSDPITQNDNTLRDPFGVKITQPEIDYYDGWVVVQDMGEILIGDVNLNGFPFEVSDYVYLTNHIMYPTLYPLDALQLANSDMNHDRVPATIGDLVYLINVIMNGFKVSTGSGDASLPAQLTLTPQSDGSIISYRTEFDVGGVLLTLRSEGPLNLDQIINRQQQMSMMLQRRGSLLQVLLYPVDGATMPAGDYPLINIVGGAGTAVQAVELASADGRTALVDFGARPAVPLDFVLKQNYPNPFNPSTTIEFDLATASLVKLTVFDLLGRQVAVLVDHELPPGTHSVVFDKTNVPGQSLASGMYLYRIATDSGSYTRKMMLLK
ncbi:MAG: T9SS type A sorting domain-containing protein [bacterium]